MKTLVHNDSVLDEIAASKAIRKEGMDSLPGGPRVRSLFDVFRVKGPVGRYFCIVFEPLSFTLTEPRDSLAVSRLEKPMAQKILASIVHGLNFLHHSGVAHTGHCLPLPMHANPN
jgi:serine/threonine protein kinase